MQVGLDGGGGGGGGGSITANTTILGHLIANSKKFTVTVKMMNRKFTQRSRKWPFLAW